MDKWDRHVGKPTILTLKSENGEEDNFTIDRLTLDDLGDWYKIIQYLSSLNLSDFKEDASEEEQLKQVKQFVGMFNEENVKILNSLMKRTMKISYPEIEDKKIEQFVAKNYFQLFFAMLKVNSNG